jgi:DNA-binding Lrp family transcriptional regulator
MLRYFLTDLSLTAVAGHLDKFKPQELRIKASKIDISLKEVRNRLRTLAKLGGTAELSLCSPNPSNITMGYTECMVPRKTSPPTRRFHVVRPHMALGYLTKQGEELVRPTSRATAPGHWIQR